MLTFPSAQSSAFEREAGDGWLGQFLRAAKGKGDRKKEVSESFRVAERWKLGSCPVWEVQAWVTSWRLSRGEETSQSWYVSCDVEGKGMHEVLSL